MPTNTHSCSELASYVSELFPNDSTGNEFAGFLRFYMGITLNTIVLTGGETLPSVVQKVIDWLRDNHRLNELPNAVAKKFDEEGPYIATHVRELLPTAQIAGSAPRLDIRVAADVLVPYVRAAKILLDRQAPELDVLMAKAEANGIVHVLAGRAGDRFLNFLDRLTELSLPCDTEGKKRSAMRLTFLKSLPALARWGKSSLEEWPAPEVPLQRALARLKRQVDDIDTSRNHLAQVVVSIETCDLERERALVPAFAAYCASVSSSERLQVFVVYLEEPRGASLLAPEDPWRVKRAQLAALWPSEAPPPGCGVCLALSEVGARDLDPWCTDLREAWSIDEDMVRTDVRGLLADRRVCMQQLETDLDGHIKRYWTQSAFNR